MAAATGTWNHHPAQAQSLPAAHPAPLAGPANGNNGGSSPGNSDSATISANDFLTLLVTEMQNQDPTSSTDPNAYIDQLVQVNSLEQLIQINQDLNTAIGGTGSSPGGTSSSAHSGSLAIPGIGPEQASTPHGAGHGISGLPRPAALLSPVSGEASRIAPGNLALPGGNPSARRVAQSLSGHRP